MQSHTVFYGVPALLGLWILAACGVALISYRKMFLPKFNSLDHSLSYALENGETVPSFLELPWETARLDNPRRASYIEALHLPSRSAETVGIAVFVHGITWTRYGMLKYMAPFIDRGWHVVAPDLPGHGGSPAGDLPAPDFGYEEKHDLGVVVDWARDRFGTDLPLVLIGESMGAATALQYAPLGAPSGTGPESWKISAVIADCPYSSAKDELHARLKATGVPRFLALPAGGIVSGLLRLRRGYFLGAASPAAAVMETPVPILFIHGTEDAYVPTEMSVSMAEARKRSGAGPTELLLVEGARHAKSVLVDPAGWFGAVFSFLEKNAVNNKNG